MQPPLSEIRRDNTFLAIILSITLSTFAAHAGAETWHSMVVPEFGDAQVMQWTQHKTLPEPAAGEVRIRVLAASASFTDIMIRKGLYAELGEEPPFVPGYDLVGIVDKVGEGVTRVRTGDRVADLTVWGAYTDYAIRPETHLVAVPEGVDSGEAVALILSYTTAYQLLYREADLKAGQTILVHGASGAVGTALTQLAVLNDITVYGTASTKKQDYVAALGATPINYSTQDFVTVVDKATQGKGVDAAFDAISLDNFRRSYRALGDQGKLITYGLYNASMSSAAGDSWGIISEFLSFQWQKLMWSWFGDADKTVSFYSITGMRGEHPDWFEHDLTTLFDLLKEGKLKAAIWRRMPLEDAAQAHTLIETRAVRGKIVLMTSP
ncbi:MAG: medium chain dehydrogenase/reductase family protein [Halioglobus sp.]